MPAKPGWLQHLSALDAVSDDLIDRATVEAALQIGPRRAQQLMAGLPGRKVGNVFLVDRAALINKLRSIAASEDSAFEADRRAQFAAKLEAMRRERI